jgi:hypothetical protein
LHPADATGTTDCREATFHDMVCAIQCVYYFRQPRNLEKNIANYIFFRLVDTISDGDNMRMQIEDWLKSNRAGQSATPDTPPPAKNN